MAVSPTAHATTPKVPLHTPSRPCTARSTQTCGPTRNPRLALALLMLVVVDGGIGDSRRGELLAHARLFSLRTLYVRILTDEYWYCRWTSGRVLTDSVLQRERNIRAWARSYRARGEQGWVCSREETDGSRAAIKTSLAVEGHGCRTDWLTAQT